jgi:threonyl-tRNA synthetase
MIVVGHGKRHLHKYETVSIFVQVTMKHSFLPKIKKPPLWMGHARPVMIHHAVLGIVERMIVILTQHFGGIWYFITLL